jgi:hypothetical protein
VFGLSPEGKALAKDTGQEGPPAPAISTGRRTSPA